MNRTYSKPCVAASVNEAVNRSLRRAHDDADHDLIVTCEEMLMVCELYTAITGVGTEI